MTHDFLLRSLCTAVLALGAAACGGDTDPPGMGRDGGAGPDAGGIRDGGVPPGTDGGFDAGPPPPPANADDDALRDALATTRFLTQATFGPTRADVARYSETSGSAWFRAQIAVPPSLLVEAVDRYYAEFEERGGEFGELAFEATNMAFWRHAVHAPDQLRQRMAFALSQVFVVSNAVGDELTEHPHAVAWFQDHLVRNAFGNYRTLLEDVTYSPAMAVYLTYLGNRRANPETGQVPDENYAREILQLFSIGVVELNADGTERLDAEGRVRETYDNTDITGLAKVFTGLDVDLCCEEERIHDIWRRRLVVVEDWVSTSEKTFLGQTIPAGTGSQESIRRALDVIFAHPNVGPFLARQLIQRFVTSDPRPAYVARVAAAFDAGTFTLPDETTVGSTGRGDLAATLAAVLFDPEARTEAARMDPGFGKIREPILRLSHWARAFSADARTPEYLEPFWSADRRFPLSQDAYRAPSVFNFFRPGFIAPGTETGAAGMTVPELQIVTSTTVPGDANYLEELVFRTSDDVDAEEYQGHWAETYGYDADIAAARRTFVGDYAVEEALASSPERLVDELDATLTFGSLSTETRADITAIVSEVSDAALRARLAAYLVLTSPDYLVQR
ncbi:MAG: DUF1800 family protein [Myxococcota bacterium]